MDPEQVTLKQPRSGIQTPNRATAGPAPGAGIGEAGAPGVIFRQTPDDHQMLIGYLLKGGNRTAGSVGAVLKDLRQERNRADYRLTEV